MECGLSEKYNLQKLYLCIRKGWLLTQKKLVKYIRFCIFDSRWNYLFRLMSLIYKEKFEFENPAIMEDKQCKQTERFSVMTKGRDYFLP